MYFCQHHLKFSFSIVVANTCIGTHPVDWNVDPVKDNMEVRFPSEKIITALTIQPNFPSDSKFAVSYSRSCADYHNVQEQGVVKVTWIFNSTLNEIVLYTQYPICFCVFDNVPWKNYPELLAIHNYTWICYFFSGVYVYQQWRHFYWSVSKAPSCILLTYHSSRR